MAWSLMALCTLATYAQQSVDSLMNLNLQQIVVTATGTPHTLKNVPVQTEVITRKQIEQLGAASFEEMLGQLCSGFDFSAGDMGSKMTMNGLGNNYILILIDGKRIHGDNGGENDLGLIDPHNIDHIEIVKGAGSALYGSDAMAGVINIITRKHTEHGLYAENTTRGAMYNDWRQHNSVALSGGKWSSQTNFQTQHSDGWQNTSREHTEGTVITDSRNKTVNRFTNWQIAERLTYQATKDLELYADGTYYRKHIYRPQNGRHASCDVYTYDLMYRNASAAVGGTWKINKTDRLTLDVDWNRHAYYYGYTATTLEEGYDMWGNPDPTSQLLFPFLPGQHSLQSDQQRTMAHLKGIFQLPLMNRLTAGAEYRYDYLHAPTRVLEGKAHDWTSALYVQDEFSLLQWFNLTAGLRLIENGAFGFHATPKASAMVSLGDLRLRMGWSQGFKSPTPKELTYQYLKQMGAKTFYYMGNPNLKAQTSNYYSTSLEYTAGRITASVTGYLNVLDNMITLVNVPVGEIPNGYTQYLGDGSNDITPRMYKNMEDARTYGADATLTYRITPQWTLGAGYSYLDTQAHVYDSEHARLNSVIIDGMAHHKGNVYLTWNHSFNPNYRLGLGLYGRASSKRYYQNDGNGKAYQVWKLSSTHDFPRGRHGLTYRLEAGVDNLLNYVDRTARPYHLGTTTPGTTVYAAFSIRFAQGKKIKTSNTILKNQTNDEQD